MENNIQIFNDETLDNITSTNVFNNSAFGDLTVITIDGDNWFILNEICEKLDVKNQTVKDRLRDKDYMLMSYGQASNLRLNRKLSHQGLALITETGLYEAIMSSRKPEAKDFRYWVCDEVLPSIRKTGGYVNNEDMFINTYLPFADETIKSLFRTQLHIVRKQNEVIAAQKQQIQEYEPKVNYYDQILSCQNAIPISIIAKDYGLGAKTLNKRLSEMKIQYKMGETWLLYAQYQNCGYTKTCTILDGYGKSHTHTNWTQKGRIFLYEKLEAVGILPLCEQS